MVGHVAQVWALPLRSQRDLLKLDRVSERRSNPAFQRRETHMGAPRECRRRSLGDTAPRSGRPALCRVRAI